MIITALAPQRLMNGATPVMRSREKDKSFSEPSIKMVEKPSKRVGNELSLPSFPDRTIHND